MPWVPRPAPGVIYANPLSPSAAAAAPARPAVPPYRGPGVAPVGSPSPQLINGARMPGVIYARPLPARAAALPATPPAPRLATPAAQPLTASGANSSTASSARAGVVRPGTSPRSIGFDVLSPDQPFASATISHDDVPFSKVLWPPRRPPEDEQKKERDAAPQARAAPSMGALRRSHACALIILAAFALGAACQLVAALAFAEVIIDFPLHSSGRCLVASLAGAGLAASCVLLGVCCRLLSVPSAAAGHATRCAAALLAASTLVAFSWLFGDEYDSPSQQLEMALDFDGDALEYAGPLYANSLALLLYAYALLRPHAPAAAPRSASWGAKLGELGGSPALV